MTLETITASAIVVNGAIFVGKRHSDAIYNAYTIVKEQIKSDCPQGFYTSQRRFIDREDGLKLAKQNGQLINKKATGILFSEDLR